MVGGEDLNNILIKLISLKLWSAKEGKLVTKTELRKIASECGLLSAMLERGFEESKKSKLFFYRKNKNAIFQMITFEILRGGENLEIATFNWVPEIHEEYDITEFPKAVKITNGGCITKKGTVGRGSKFWDLRNLQKMNENCVNILESIDLVAIPWLDSVRTRNDLIENIFLDIKDSPFFSPLKKRLLDDDSSY